ncbi:MAG TPA: GNAT family N-acetyltransferase [Terriglobia bacterium]|nr:GNAT family N-acetyltransferase [Terriglobia bacterium]
MDREIVDIRHFDARDFASLLEVESNVWRSKLRWDYTSSARLISSCLEEKRLSGYALIQQDRIQGYSFFFYEDEKALIGDLFVAAENGSSAVSAGPALVLVEHVIETLLATPGLRRIEGQLPHYSFEELDPCFRKHGFASYRRRFMAVPLKQRPVVAGPLVNAFALEPWERKHDRAVSRLVYHAYRAHVDSIINDQYSSVEGTTRLVDNIIHHHGCGEYLRENSLVAVHKPTRKLAAMLALTAVRPSTAHIPQVAVAREFQGRGLGTAMMGHAFGELAQAGYQEVSLTVTDENEGAVQLYERLGFDTFRNFGAFVWTRE